MAWIYNLAYSFALLLLLPVIIYRNVRHGRYRRGWAAKLFGRLQPPRGDQHPVIWFHAVSVGEVLQLSKLISEFQAATGQRFHPLITTSTDTGYDLAVQRFPDAQVDWFPLDFTWSVKAALRRIQPRAVVLVELELWPNFLNECRRQQIPTAVINTRISERSFAGYSRFPWIFRPVFESLNLAVAQSETYATRLRQLGCPEEAVVVSGNLKFDGIETARNNPRTNELRKILGLKSDDVVFLAGSTQAPEESIALDAWQEARKIHPHLRIILVPRHKERFQEVASLIRERGFPLVQRSTLDQHATLLTDSPDYHPVILIDTIGELSAAWGLADIAFVGGSFGNRGGQNMLEPAAYGAAVTFGPNTKNFRDIVSRLLQDNAALQLQTPEELSSTLTELLSNEEQRHALGARSAECVLKQQGAVAFTVRELCQLIGVETRRSANAA